MKMKLKSRLNLRLIRPRKASSPFLPATLAARLPGRLPVPARQTGGQVVVKGTTRGKRSRIEDI
ncbi:MAG: hypothetical protein HY695_30380 [Deltaproteobacteria bacterium]|nr:hypothetical protein [Deltaproteobacteria bacterium]